MFSAGNRPLAARARTWRGHSATLASGDSPAAQAFRGVSSDATPGLCAHGSLWLRRGPSCRFLCPRSLGTPNGLPGPGSCAAEDASHVCPSRPGLILRAASQCGSRSPSSPAVTGVSVDMAWGPAQGGNTERADFWGAGAAGGTARLPLESPQRAAGRPGRAEGRVCPPIAPVRPAG